MNRNIVGTFGFLLILVGVTLPFARLERSNGDMSPSVTGLVTFVVGVIVLFRAMRPVENSK